MNDEAIKIRECEPDRQVRAKGTKDRFTTDCFVLEDDVQNENRHENIEDDRANQTEDIEMTNQLGPQAVQESWNCYQDPKQPPSAMIM